MILRTNYFDILNKYKDKPYIKVLTGLRHVWKTTLLNTFSDYLVSEGIKQENILKINFELPSTFDINDYKSLINYVMDWASNKKEKCYLFLDEISRVLEWEKAVNAFHSLNIFDIYITGSNADLLSSDLSTYLAGRYIEILIHPFSYKEFIMMFPKSDFKSYITFGGIPSIYPLNLDYDITMNVLRDSFKSAVLQDVIGRYKIRNVSILEKIIQYVFTNVGRTFSALSIYKYFKSLRINVTVDTLLSYLMILQEAFLIYKVSRNDLIGKQILKTEEKYYISNHGFREAISGNNFKVI